MDPDVALHELRTLVEARLAATRRWKKGDAERMAELVDALDGWLVRGGFLPKRWDVPRGQRK